MGAMLHRLLRAGLLGFVVPGIHARVEYGALGLVLGSTLGAVAGIALGAAIASAVECGYENRQLLCSPQEESLREALTLVGLATGSVLGAAVGWKADAVTWQEAVEQIRRERESAAGGPR